MSKRTVTEKWLAATTKREETLMRMWSGRGEIDRIDLVLEFENGWIAGYRAGLLAGKRKP